MRGRTLLIILGVICMGMLLTRCGSTETVRYRMTVEVETPQGLRTGSSVREVTAYSPWVINPSSRTHFDLSGEAVAVDLPGGRVLFALLVSGGHWQTVDYAARVPSDLMGWLSPEGITQQAVELWPNPPAAGGSDDIADKWPMLVTFTNLRDPMSVERVDPANLSAQFGEGVRLRRITVQVTDDDVTEGMEERLGQLGLQPGDGLDSTLGVTTHPTLAQQLGYSDFIRGKDR